MGNKYYVDDDGYIVHDKSGDTVAHILYNEHIEPLTRIFATHAELVTASQDLVDQTCQLKNCGSDYVGTGKWQSPELKTAVVKAVTAILNATKGVKSDTQSYDAQDAIISLESLRTHAPLQCRKDPDFTEPYAEVLGYLQKICREGK